jgi:hypothetical protein
VRTKTAALTSCRRLCKDRRPRRFLKATGVLRPVTGDQRRLGAALRSAIELGASLSRQSGPMKSGQNQTCVVQPSRSSLLPAKVCFLIGAVAELPLPNSSRAHRCALWANRATVERGLQIETHLCLQAPIERRQAAPAEHFGG